MTLTEIRQQLPMQGVTCGMDVDKMRTGSPENWMDKALEKMVCEAIQDGNLFKAGMTTAMQVMAISMTLSGVDWEVIQNAMEAMEGYMS